MKILVVDDELAIRRLLKGALERGGYDTIEAQDAREALHRSKAGCDLCLLDLGLPDRDGLELIPLLTQNGVPTIVLTARDATSEKVAALDLGADDFVTKPFDSEELLARIRGALRRSGAAQSASGQRQFADGTIDELTREVVVRGSAVALTPKEFELLWKLSEHPGRVLTHRVLLATVWGEAHLDDLDYLRVAVRSLRRKIEENPATPKVVVNEPGVGYRLAARG